MSTMVQFKLNDNLDSKSKFVAPIRYKEKEESKGVWVYRFESLRDITMQRFSTVREAINMASRLKGAKVLLKGKEIRYQHINKNTVVFRVGDNGEMQSLVMNCNR